MPDQSAGRLGEARRSWDEFWSKGMRLEFLRGSGNSKISTGRRWPIRSSSRNATPTANLDAGWPGVYREFWGRGEYFQGRAIEAAGYLDIGKETVRHTLSLQKDDGEWDWPVTSGWPAWDNIGGNAASVWDYYLYSRDRQWLASTYPYLARAADWIRLHREESMVPEDAPAAASPSIARFHGSVPTNWSLPLRPEKSTTGMVCFRGAMVTAACRRVTRFPIMCGLFMP